jgi:hypothetical protein
MTLDLNEQKRLLQLIDFLYNDVMSAGGDGDGLWFTRYYSLDDILELVKQYNDSLHFKWDVTKSEDCIIWADGQEGLVITTNENVYNNAPSWQQILIKY